VRGTMVLGTLVVATILIASGFAYPDDVVPQPVPPPLHSKYPDARLFDDTIIVKYKEKRSNNEQVVDATNPEQRKVQMDDIAANFSTVPGLSGLTVIRTLPILAVQHFKLGQGQLLNTVILLLRNHPSVQYAEYNFRVLGQSAPPKDPDDPQWLNGYFWGLRKIGMRSAWGYQTDASNIIVAVLDSGIDYRHPDLMGNMWSDPGMPSSHGKDFCANPTTNDPLDKLGHGTQVAGIIGARGNNNYGAVGADWEVQLLALKMLCTIEEQSGKPEGSLANAEAALEEAMSKGAVIINNSWRVRPPVDDSDIQTLEDAVRKTNCEGVVNCKPALFVAAAGNRATDDPSLNSDPCNGSSTDCNGVVFPANYGAAPYNVANVISVAATTCPDLLTHMGPSPTCAGDPLLDISHYGATTVHIAAPGDKIDTTDIFDSTDPGNSYTNIPGTSASAPHVSGCAALLHARNLAVAGALLSITDIKNKLFNNADANTVKDPTNPMKFGVIDGRRLNCARAIANTP
jgi:subtilisin family serine protease